MSILKKTLAVGVASLIALAMNAPALAQPYPSRLVKIIVPYAPGGTNDIVARVLAKELQVQTGQPFIVENKAGASGNIGADAVAKSPPDGYTLILVTGGHAVAPSLYSKLSYNLKTDLVPVSELTAGPMLVLVKPDGPYKTLKDLIAAAKAHPDKISFGSAGNGSTTHLSGEMLATEAGVKMQHVPYKGSTPAMADVMAGNLDFVFDLMTSAMPQVKGGKLRAIAITSLTRSPAVPEVPTVDEQGLKGFETSTWNGLMAPAGTPKEVIAKLNSEIVKAMAKPQIKEQFGSQGLGVVTGTPEQFGALINAEITRWSKVVKASGARID